MNTARPVSVALIAFGAVLAASLAFAAPSLHLDSSGDRAAFRRWFTFLTESRYYARKPLREVSDGQSLIRWAFHHALGPHDSAWSRHIELPVFPAMPSVRQFELLHEPPDAPDPFAPLLISRDVTGAEPGDLLLYRNAQLGAHLMVYIGPSQIVPSPKKWVVYHSSGTVHKMSLDALLTDPSPDWRPAAENPDFLGVWRLDILNTRD